MTWIADLFAALLARLASYLFAMGLEWYHGVELQKTTDADIDSRLLKFKESYKEAFNGEPISSEQRKALKSAISDFLRGDSGGV